ncbi:hypothetical protein BpHYR1_041366 [Brachionus plicatilis]|uniref:HTH psq-type domain-containing protein n=1 Tax=Brachionus plicatilis TaxID=10195 RepID=A0A3M7SL77_BRAPC|nr:hypothetical protein BpHYR1_041366 [Brachionus plicatilis]
MTDKLAQKKRKCISLETKLEILKKHCDHKITTTTLSKEYGVNTSTISIGLVDQASVQNWISNVLLDMIKDYAIDDFLFGDLESECNENDDFKEIWTFEKKLNFEKYAYVSIDSKELMI